MLNARAKLSPDSDKNRSVSNSRIPLFRVVTFCGLGSLGFLADVFSKAYIFGRYFIPYQSPIQHWWIEGVLGVETTTNPGALFGMFAGYRWLFAALSVVALACIIVWLFVLGGAHDRWLNTSLGLVTGGILGNLYDRLGFGFRANYPAEIQYNVRDWVYFRIKGVPLFDPWPNFNIADSLLVCGAILLVLHSFFGSTGHRQDSESDAMTPQDSNS